MTTLARFSAEFLACGPWDNPVFSDPDLIASAAALTAGQPMPFSVVARDGAAGIMMQGDDGGALRLFTRTLRGPANPQVPWAGVTHKNATPTLLEDLADQVFAARWDRLVIGPFPDFDDVTARFAEICGGRAAATEEASGDYHSVNGLTTLQELLQAQSKKGRRNQRRAVRLVDDRPENDLVVLTGADTPSGMERFLEVDRQSWKAENGEAILSYPDLSDYYRSLAKIYGPAGEAAVLLVGVEGEDAAGIFMLVRDGIGYLVKTSFVQRVDTGSFSLGTAAILCGIRWLLEDQKVRRVMVLSNADYTRYFAHGTVTMRLCRVWRANARARLLRSITPPLTVDHGSKSPNKAH